MSSIKIEVVTTAAGIILQEYADKDALSKLVLGGGHNLKITEIRKHSELLKVAAIEYYKTRTTIKMLDGSQVIALTVESAILLAKLRKVLH